MSNYPSKAPRSFFFAKSMAEPFEDFMNATDKTEKMPSGVLALVELTCGCADQDKLWPPVIAELERLENAEYDGEADGWVPCIVDSCGLSEHGGSIRGGWLTDEGKKALGFFRRWGVDWADKAEFVAPDGTHLGLV